MAKWRERSEWFRQGWRASLREVMELRRERFVGLFTGYAGCLTWPIVVLLAGPCIALAFIVLPLPAAWEWALAIPIGLLAAVVGAVLALVLWAVGSSGR